jgi:hypothetical protein
MSTKGILVIIPCGLQKIWKKLPDFGPCPARNVYTGAPFTVNRRFAEKCADKWMILSAKYGYIEPDFIIPGNYNVTFKNSGIHPISQENLIGQIREKRLDKYPVIYGLGGKDYRILIKNTFAAFGRTVEFPFEGKGKIGEMMRSIKKKTKECNKVSQEKTS